MADKAASKSTAREAVRDAAGGAGKAGHKASGKPGGKRSAATAPAPTPSGPPLAWGQDLAAYPDWLTPYLPAMHDAFNYVNRYVSVPALRAGLGMYMSNPVTGYLMILRTRGRKTGEMRDAPLGYVVVGDAVYCMAGFGSRTNWLQNIHADPHVEVILPSRSFSGLAQEVTDEAERRAILPALLRSMGLVVMSLGMGSPWRMQSAEMIRKCEGLPLVRVRATGIAAGPTDPGGKYWVVPLVLSALGLVWLLRRGGSKQGRR
jgi:deazaflavin-dependent oxidoreductase (nitroreductase family)